MGPSSFLRRCFPRLGLAVLALGLVGAGPRSGREDASPAVRAMQDDDAANPGMLWVEQGRAVWGAGCAGCHGDVGGMRGVAARYPVMDRGRPLTLAGRVNQCRTERAGAGPWAEDAEEMLAATALVGQQSRGVPMAVEAGGEAASWVERGAAVFQRRVGQLNLSCAQCHDGLAGQRLGGARIPEGHPNGYPLYRLEWQGLGSLERRLRNCQTGVRAEPYAAGSDELAALRLYLGVRATGLVVETPAVRP